MTYAALEWAAVDVVRVELTDCHGSILMRIHLDEREPTVGLKASLENVAEVLEQRHQVILRGVRGQIADVAGGLPLGSLLDDHVITLHTLSGEVVVSKRSGGGHAHGSHGLLLRYGRLTLLVGPVAADGARSKPLAVHSVESLISIGAVPESNKSVSTRASSLHIPHHTSFGDRTKGGEGLSQDLVVHFVAQVTNKDVEVVRGILLVCAV